MSKHGWILLNVPEYVWINCSDYVRVLNMLWYSSNNIIIIVANVIISEFLSARFIHPGALLYSFVISADLLYNLIRRGLGRVENKAFTPNSVISSKQYLGGLKITNWSVFPVNFAKFLRTLISTEHFRRLLLFSLKNFFVQYNILLNTYTKVLHATIYNCR